jgi:hypothetical protein
MLSESVGVSVPLLVLQCDVESEYVAPVLSACFCDSLVSIISVEVVNNCCIRIPSAFVNSFLIELLGQLSLTIVSCEISIRIFL